MTQARDASSGLLRSLLSTRTKSVELLTGTAHFSWHGSAVHRQDDADLVVAGHEVYSQKMFKLLGSLLSLAAYAGVVLLWARPATGLAWLLVLAPVALAWWVLSVFFQR